MTTIAHVGVVRVVVGVDTHRDVNVAVVIDHLGRRLGSVEIPTTAAGYRDLLRWARSFGEVEAWGVEGTGCYGAGLARFLGAKGERVLEVIRPNRQVRRRKGKSDPTDAEAAARAVLSGEASAVPKGGDDLVEMIRVLRLTRSTAVKARTQGINVLRALVVTAPPELRQQLRGLPIKALIRTAARLRPGNDRSVLAHTKLALRSAAQRCEALDAEIGTLDARLDELTAEAAPDLLEHPGVGPETAATLLVATGDDRHRIRSEAAFAKLCGVSPIPASSGQIQRHRLDRGGNRQANAALYRIVLVRMRWDPRTKDYVARRTQEGKTKKEIIRCLKRYVAREIFTALKATARPHPVVLAA
ncbi:MAG: IS110 family transposase [Actinomycetota bacterium]